MEKIADNYYCFKEVKFMDRAIKIDMEIDRIDGEDLDTTVKLTGKFAICGSDRDELCEKLIAIIDEYRI